MDTIRNTEQYNGRKDIKCITLSYNRNQKKYLYNIFPIAIILLTYISRGLSIYFSNLLFPTNVCSLAS